MSRFVVFGNVMMGFGRMPIVWPFFEGLVARVVV